MNRHITRTARTPSGCYDVKDFGAVGDGSADDTPFIHAAFAAAKADNVGAVAVTFPPGTYRLTAPILIDGVNDLTVSATCGANIDYSVLSANGLLVENTVFLTPTAARNAFYFKNCARLRIHTADNTISFSQGTSNVTPVYRHNYLLRGSITSQNPQLISTSDSNPVIEGNLELRNNVGQGASSAMSQSVT